MATGTWQMANDGELCFFYSRARWLSTAIAASAVWRRRTDAVSRETFPAQASRRLRNIHCTKSLLLEIPLAASSVSVKLDPGERANVFILCMIPPCLSSKDLLTFMLSPLFKSGLHLCVVHLTLICPPRMTAHNHVTNSWLATSFARLPMSSMRIFDEYCVGLSAEHCVGASAAA